MAENPGGSSDRFLLATALDCLREKAALEESIAILSELLVEEPGPADYRYELSNARAYLGSDVCFNNSDLAGAELNHREALRLREGLVREFPDVYLYQRKLAISLNDMGRDLRADPSRMDRDAVSTFPGTAPKARGKLPLDSFNQKNVAVACTNLGGVLRDMGRYVEAEHLIRQAIATEKDLTLRIPSCVKTRGSYQSFRCTSVACSTGVAVSGKLCRSIARHSQPSRFPHRLPTRETTNAVNTEQTHVRKRADPG